MLGGGASGAAFVIFFVLPSATRIKLPMPTMKASGKSSGWSSFDQFRLTPMLRMSPFVLHPDVGLKIDQARIILRFHRFPNRLFEFVQLQSVGLADLPTAKPLFTQLDVGRMHHQDLFFGIFTGDNLRDFVEVPDKELLVRQQFAYRDRGRF